MSRYNVGDKVRIKDYMSDIGAMTEFMLEEFGGKVCTISNVVTTSSGYGKPFNYYILEEDTTGFKWHFIDEDIECLVSGASTKTQRIEIPVPGGHLVAETCDWGGSYPGIFLSFIASGGEVEHGLCFAEVCVEDNPDVIRVGTYYRDADDVKDIFEYPMWKKEEENNE